MVEIFDANFDAISRELHEGIGPSPSEKTRIYKADILGGRHE